MKETTKLKWRLASSLAMCALALFSAVSLTLSWFAYNDRANGGGMEIAVEYSSEILGVEFYTLERSTGGGGYTLTALAAGEEPALGAYDATKENYSVAVKIYVKRGETPRQLTLTASTTAEYFLGDSLTGADGSVSVPYPLLPPSEADRALPDTTGKTYTNSLTSIVRFAVLTEEETESLRGGALAALPADDRFSAFIDTEQREADGTRRPAASITLSQTPGGTHATASPETAQYRGQDCDAVFVLIAYDPLLVNTVFSANIGNEEMYQYPAGSDVPYPIPFVCDFKLTASC